MSKKVRIVLLLVAVAGILLVGSLAIKGALGKKTDKPTDSGAATSLEAAGLHIVGDQGTADSGKVKGGSSTSTQGSNQTNTGQTTTNITPTKQSPTVQDYAPNYNAVISGFAQADNCFLEALNYMASLDFTNMNAAAYRGQWDVVYPLKNLIDLGYVKEAASPKVATLRVDLSAAYSSYIGLFGEFWPIEILYNYGETDSIGSSISSMKTDWLRAKSSVDAAKNEWAAINK
jgi:hypothetical protein